MIKVEDFLKKALQKLFFSNWKNRNYYYTYVSESGRPIRKQLWGPSGYFFKHYMHSWRDRLVFFHSFSAICRVFVLNILAPDADPSWTYEALQSIQRKKKCIASLDWYICILNSTNWNTLSSYFSQILFAVIVAGMPCNDFWCSFFKFL